MTGCGACLEVQALCARGGNATSSQVAGCTESNWTGGVIVTVVDACPGCPGDVLALHYLAASRLGPASEPSISARYRQVACQPPAPIVISVDDYDLQGQGYLRLHLERVGGSGGIKALWARSTAAGDAWSQLSNINGTAEWELSGVPPAPLDLLIYPAGAPPLLAARAIIHGGSTGAFQTAVQVQPTAPPATAAGPTASPASEAATAAAPAASPAAEAATAVEPAASPAAEAATAAEAASPQLPAVEPAPSGEPALLAAPAQEVVHASPPGQLQAAVWAALAPALAHQVQQAVQEPAAGASPAGGPAAPAAEPAAEAALPAAAGSRQDLIAAALAPALAAGVAQQVAAGGVEERQPQPAAEAAALKSLPVPLPGSPPLHTQEAAPGPAAQPAPELPAPAAEPPGPAAEPSSAGVAAVQPAASGDGTGGGSSTGTTIGIAVGSAGAAVVVGLAAGLTWYRLARRRRQHAPQGAAAKGVNGSSGGAAAAAKLVPPPQAYPYWTTSQAPDAPHQALEYVLADFPTAHLPPALPPPVPATLGQPVLPPSARLGSSAAPAWQQSQLYSTVPRAAGPPLSDDLLSTYGGVFAMDRGPSQLDSLASTCGAVRSTAEYRQLDTHQREQAERSLMATLQEEDMWAQEPGPRSPALSLDSMHSGAATSTEQHPPPRAGVAWSQPAQDQQGGYLTGSAPPPGAVPFHVRHPAPAAPPAGAPAPPLLAASLPGGRGRTRGSLVRRAEDFTLSADSFTSTTNPALFTRDSTDVPMAGGVADTWWQQQQPAVAPSSSQPAPLRFSGLRQAAARAAANGTDN
ncbi:hypothetical protein ABPG75_000119 [Micractinium tetrahymenae]